jgi:protein phosphatase
MDQSSSAWNHCLEYAALSDVGLRRANNQDSYAAIPAGNQADFEQRGHLFMVADGMGAHAAGELASKMATDAVALIYRKRQDQPPPEAILSALQDANHQIHSRGQASPDFRGMGTTATALVLLPAGAIVAHVGDSRAYRLRGTQLHQLTFDHSLVWEIRAAGQTPNGELPGYISKNIITRSLGPNPVVQVDMEGPYPLHVGDTFLLCSDGLSNQVKDDELGMVLSCLPPAEAAEALVDLALVRGGPDNITVVIAKVLGPQIAQPTGADSSGHTVAANAKPIHPLVWTILAVALLSALGLLTLGSPVGAIIAFAAALLTSIVGMVQRYGGLSRAEIDPRRFGRGPYVTCDASVTPDLLTRLAEVIRVLREGAAKEGWPVDEAVLDRILTQAASTSQTSSLTDAARASLRAIIYLMVQRRQHRNASTDSKGPAID